MLTIVLSALLVAILLIIYQAHDYYFNWVDTIMFSILGLLFGGLLGVCIALAFPMQIGYKQYSYPIASIKDNSSVSGQFFLGSGQVQGTMVYVFYTEENGVYRMNQAPYANVEIIFTEKEPKVYVTEPFRTDAWQNLFALDLTINPKTYVISVPNGSIKSVYNLDAE